MFLFLSFLYISVRLNTVDIVKTYSTSSRNIHISMILGRSPASIPNGIICIVDIQSEWSSDKKYVSRSGSASYQDKKLLFFKLVISPKLNLCFLEKTSYLTILIIIFKMNFIVYGISNYHHCKS